MRATRHAELVAARLAALASSGLPVGIGQQALARAYLARRPWPRDSLVVQRVNGVRVMLNLGDGTQAKAFLTRRYEPALVRYVVNQLPQDGVFIDVGAHIGLVTFSVARRRRGARIFAIEADPRNAEAWLQNKGLSAAQLPHLDTTAISDFSGTAVLSNQGDSGAHHISLHDVGTHVPVTTLDEWAERHQLEHFDVLKLDVEGGEPAALRGARRLLAAGNIRTLVCEMNDAHLERVGSSRSEVSSFLHNFGYLSFPIPKVGAQRLRHVSREAADVVFQHRRRGSPDGRR